jgi:hypothetical protein
MYTLDYHKSALVSMETLLYSTEHAVFLSNKNYLTRQKSNFRSSRTNILDLYTRFSMFTFSAHSLVYCRDTNVSLQRGDINLFACLN